LIYRSLVFLKIYISIQNITQKTNDLYINTKHYIENYNWGIVKGKALLTIGYTNFSHVTIVFIAKYLFTGSVKILNSIQRGESPFQEKCMDFHEMHPRVAYDLAHVCISWSVHTNKWRTTHNALCEYYKFSTWCQIERAARLRLRLGNLLHLHAIRDSKTWNDSDKTSMTGKFFSFYGKQLVDIISFLLEFSFKFIWIFQNINNKRFQDFSLK
jgi:uncharacterized membrane protein